MSECSHCEGAGRLPVGEYGGDCAAIHGMGGRVPDPPAWEPCEHCNGRGQVDDPDEQEEALQ